VQRKARGSAGGSCTPKTESTQKNRSKELLTEPPPCASRLHRPQEKGPAGEDFTWDAAKRVLGDANFIKRLTEFDRDALSERVVRQLQRVMADPQFTPEQARGLGLLPLQGKGGLNDWAEHCAATTDPPLVPVLSARS
jgi:hypothetical protein